MTWIDAILLGILQGITEFFPISSSGHLILGQYFLGLTHLEEHIPFDLVCHLGTLLAILWVFYPQIKELVLGKWQSLMLATLPLFPLVLIMKPIKQLFNAPQYLGYFFLLTAAVLYLGERFGKEQPQKRPLLDPLIIGMAQAVAILPGISRSGSTLSAARLLGWTPSEALTFSFLLAIPTILGGVAIEGLQIAKAETLMQIPVREYCLGFFFSFMVGVITLKKMVNLANNKKMNRFALYCAIVGIICLFYLS